VEMMQGLAPQSIRFGAAAAFRYQLATFALAGVTTGIGFDTAGSALEKTFQRQLGTAALRFQLGLGWNWPYAQANPYALTVVDQVLIQAGLSTGAPLRGAAALRYQGLVGEKADLDRTFKATQSAPAGATSIESKPEAISGGLTIRQSRKGRYTAVLRLSDGTVYRGKGSTLSNGAIKASWPASGTKSATNVVVDIYRMAPQGFVGLYGDISRGDRVLAAIAAEDTKTRLSSVIGPQRFDLGAGGTAELKVSQRSRARVRGQLPDGKRFTSSTPLWRSATAGDRVLLFRPLRQRSPIRGWLDNTAPDKTWQATLSWQ
jgi:hypothetical protein